ncbi:MAG: chromosome segregation protein SMC [candidate division WOR-3 bacterium]
MYIKELQLFGFKSFQEKTTLRFSAGMNCIIGPNGCGKSNVLDALRWVLGEQSFSVLRCARNEDLIFAGTSQVPALNYAEVRLVLSTEDRPELGSEVEIRRRFFRSGESEYYLNRQPCRLRDIQDLFLSAGIGTKAYSIFDLRQMREIIAGNIRQMFEEAATLAKFRDAKEECQRKLELTQKDLTRLEDIIAERERVVRSLQRQAAKLRAYQRLKEEENSLRLVELRQVYKQLNTELEGLEREIRGLEEADAERTMQVKRLEEELHTLHSRLVNLQGERERALTELNRWREELSQLETKGLIEEQEMEFLLRNAAEWTRERDRLKDEITRLEGVFNQTLVQLQEANNRLGEIQSRLKEVQAITRGEEEELLSVRQEEEQIREVLRGLLENQQQVRTRVIRLEAEIENNRSVKMRILEERQRVAEQLAKTEADLRALNAEAEKVKSEMERLRQEANRRRQVINEIEKRLGEIKEEREKLLKEKGVITREVASLEAKVARPEIERVKAVFGVERLKMVSHLLAPKPGWERACEVALYYLIEFFTGVEIDGGSFDRLLTGAPEMRFGFLIDVDAKRFPDEVRLRADDERIAGNLTDFVEVKPEAPALVKQAVNSFQVVKSRDSFFQIIKEEPRARLVTKDGFACFGDGRVVIAGEDWGSIKAEVKINEEETRLSELEQTLRLLEDEERGLAKKRGEVAREWEGIESQLVLREREQFACESKLTTTVSVVTELRREEERLGKEERRIEDLLKNQEENLRGEQERTQAIAREIEKRQAELATLEERSTATEAKVKGQLKEAAEVLAAMAEEQARIQRLEVEAEHLKGSIAERRNRIAELEGSISQAEKMVEGIRQEKVHRQQELERLRAQVRTAEAELARDNVWEVSSAAEAVEKNLAEVREEQQRKRELLFQRRLERAEIEAKVRSLLEEAKSVGGDLETAGEAPDVDVKRLEEVRQRLAALGQVNPLALDEYEQEKKDLERLLFQRDDVLQAKENLQNALQEIDRHAREQFLNTYQQVRHEFQEVFKELFLEGEADLILLNDSNPLESEVAIIAKPQGKNPKRLEQLSDGEKAMLAVSLLFAFYRVKPAPFCFLDEIDAPLDDANVARFADYLKRMAEKTQVVIITHNRTTVERADVIFGVTAEQPGISKLISVSLADYRTKNAQANLGA